MINVIVDPRGAQQGVRVVEREIQRVSNGADRLRRLLIGAFVAGGLTAAIRNSVSLLADFEQGMAGVRAVTAATAAEFKTLEERALSLGTKNFSAAEAADSMFILGQSGLKTNQILATTRQIMQFAQAGILGLESAASIAVNTLRGFRLQIDQVSRVTDVLIKGANESTTTVEQLADAMKFVAPVAAGTNVSLEETVAALGALADAGLKASLGGTGLRRVISELESPTPKTIKILRGLGLSIQEVRVSSVGLTTALARLRDAGLDAGQGLEVFGERGGPAFEILARSLPSVDALTGALRDAGGETQRVSNIMNDTLGVTLKELKNSLGVFFITLTRQGAGSAFTSFIQRTSQSLRNLTADIERAIHVIEGLAFVLGVTLATKAINLLILQINRLTLALTLNPFGTLLKILVVLIGAIIAFGDEFEAASGSVGTFYDVISVVFADIKELLFGIGASAQLVFALLTGYAEDAVGDIDLSFRGFARGTAKLADLLLSTLGGTFFALVELFKGLPNAIGDGIVSAINAALGLLEVLLDTVAALLITVGQQFRAFGVAILNFFRQIGESIKASLRGNFTEAFQLAKKAGDDFTRDFAGVFTEGKFGENLLEQVSSELIPKLDNIFKNGGVNMAKAMASGFSEFNTSSVLKYVDSVLARAEAAGAARKKLREEEAADQKLRETQFGQGLGVLPPLADPNAVLPVLSTTLRDRLGEIAEETRLLALNSQQREVAREVLQTELDLRREGLELSDEERANLTLQLENLQRLRDQADAVDQLLAPQENLRRGQIALNGALQDGLITLEQYTVALRGLQIQALEAGRSYQDGIERAFLKLQDDATNDAAAIEQTLVNAFQSAEDALVQFVTTGKLEFSSLVDSILADVARMLIKKGISAAAGAAEDVLISAAFQAAFATFGLAKGGPANAGQSYIVGEEGPEIFTPKTAGVVTPADQTASILNRGNGNGQAIQVRAPDVHVKVVNAGDPDEALNAIDSPAGERKILNIIKKNKKALGQV